MKKYITKKRILVISLIILTFSMLYLSTNIVLHAQTQNGQNQQQDEPKDIKCTIDMRPFLKEKSKEFRDYLTQHFQNKSTNSSLLDLALKKFQQYKKDLNTKFKSYYPQAGLPQYSETLDTLQCYKQMTDEITLSEELLKKYFVETSNIKTTSTLMEKLKNMNENLDKLSSEVNQMYGKWEGLKGRISCYVSGCVGG